MGALGVVENGRGIPVRVSRSSNAPSPAEVEAVDEDWEILTIEQDEFCWNYAANSECFHSGAASYKKAYDVEDKTARECACRLLAAPKILKRIQHYLRLSGFTVEKAQAVHADLMLNAEDEKTRLTAVKLLYDFEGKLVKKTESTHINLNLSGLLQKAKAKTEDSGGVIDAEIEIESEEKPVK